MARLPANTKYRTVIIALTVTAIQGYRQSYAKQLKTAQDIGVTRPTNNKLL